MDLSFNPKALEVVQPDQVLTPTGQVVGTLDPCPVCGTSSNTAPETFGPSGTDVPAWAANEHCYKCGYRPATDTTTMNIRNQMWAQFEQFLKDRTAQDMAHPTVSTDNSGELATAATTVDDVLKQMTPDERKAYLEAKLAEEPS